MADEGPTTAVTLIAKFKGDDSDVMESIRRVKAAAIELGATDVDVKVETSGAGKAVADLEAVKAATESLDTSDERLFVTQQKVSGQNQKHLQQWQAITLAVFALLPLFGPLLGYSVAVAGALTAMGVSGIAALYGIKQEMERGTATGNEYAAGIQVLKQDLNELGHTSAVAMLTSYERVVGLVQDRMPTLNRDTAVFAGILGTTGTAVVSGVLNAFQALTPLLITGAVYVERIGLGFQQWASGGGVQKFGNYALNVLPQVADTLGQIAKLALDVVEAAAPWGGVMLGAIRAVAGVLDTFPMPTLGAIVAGAIAGYAAWRLWNGASGGITAVRDAVKGVKDVVAAYLPVKQADIDLSALHAETMVAEGAAAEVAAAGEVTATAATTGLGAALDFATGPLGVVLAALGAVAAIVTVVASNTTEATKATTDYTAAVQEDNGAIGDNVRLQTAKALADSGAYDAAKKLGIANRDVLASTIDQAMGVKGVSDALVKQIDWTKYASGYTDELWSKTGKVNDADVKYAKNVDSLTSKTDAQSKKVKEAIKAYNDQQEALGLTTIKTGAAGAAQERLAATYGMSVTQYINAKDAQKQTADQLAAVTNQMVLQNDAAGLLKQALDILNGKTLDLAEAQTGMAAANNSLSDSIRQNGLVIEGNSKAAVANQQAIQASVESAQQYAEAVGTATGSSEKARQALIDSKTQMEDTLRSQGLLTDSVQAYIDKIFQIPKTVNTQVDIDTAVAALKVQQLAAEIVKLGAQYQSVTSRMPGSIAVTKAMGGTIGGYAVGGTPGFAAGDGPSGTVYGPGSTTSDSIITRLSLDEEVIRASSARQVRPLLKAINKDPKQAVADVMAVGAATGSKVEKHYHLHIDGTGPSPDGLFAEFSRRMELRKA